MKLPRKVLDVLEPLAVIGNRLNELTSSGVEIGGTVLIPSQLVIDAAKVVEAFREEEDDELPPDQDVYDLMMGFKGTDEDIARFKASAERLEKQWKQMAKDTQPWSEEEIRELTDMSRIINLDDPLHTLQLSDDQTAAFKASAKRLGEHWNQMVQNLLPPLSTDAVREFIDMSRPINLDHPLRELELSDDEKLSLADPW